MRGYASFFNTHVLKVALGIAVTAIPLTGVQAQDHYHGPPPGPTAVHCANRTVSLDDRGLREDHFVALSGVSCLPGSLTITSYPITFALDKSDTARISAVTVCCVALAAPAGQTPSKPAAPAKK